MKRLLLTVATCYCCMNINAQIVEVKSTEPILRGVESEMYYPVLSCDGSKLLFTSSNFSGLKMYDVTNDVTVKISDADRAGFDASFSLDGENVYFVAQELDGKKAVSQAKNYNIKSGEQIAITEVSRAIDRPIAVKGGVMTIVDGQVNKPTKINKAVRVDGSTLYITNNGVEKAYNPIANSVGYIWASLSPDETKVLFFAAGKGIVVTDLNGNIISQLGNYEAPTWFGNDCIIAMNAKNNGYQHISSQIVIMRVDGSEIQELTKPESMAMYPTASFNAGKIVYNTIDGRLYQMNVSVK